MPEIPTYTASGQTRGGPVLAPTPASALDQTGRAAVGLGLTLGKLGEDAAQIAEQRRREDELRWATESVAQYSRVLSERRAADAQKPRETEGIEFRDFADQQLSEYTKHAPSGRAAQMFRSHALNIANSGYEKALHAGEQTRLIKADLSNDKATADIVSTYKSTAALDSPVGAAMDISGLVNLQLASIQTRFGESMPAMAEKMRKHLVGEVALGTASTNPDYAHQLVNSAPVDEKFKVALNGEIDRIARNANETATFNLVKMVENSIAVGYDKLVPVPPPNPAILNALPENQAAKLTHDVAVANKTISEFSKVKSWNWQEQQKSLAGINIEGDPVAEEAKAQLVKMLAKSKQQQTENPAGWQLANDPEFSHIPADETPAQRVLRMDRMVSLQGTAPVGTSEDQKKRYLNLPTGLQKVFQVEQATARAAGFNNSPPNQLTAMVDQFNAEFPNAKIAAMAWNDMQTLPESDRLKMGIRVAAAIDNIQVRNHFLGVMSNKDVVKPEDTKAVFESQVYGNPDYQKFVSGWIGDGGQRSAELNEFSDAILKYSMHLSAVGGLETGAAVDMAVKRVITANYATMSINGSSVPLPRFPKGGPVYEDDAAQAIQVGITDALRNLDVNSLSTDLFHFPLQPRLPGNQKEANEYLAKTIRATGTVAVEPDGKSATVYIKGEGENDFPFQLRGADGEPIVLDFDNMLTRGVIITREQEIMRSGTLKQQQDIQEQRRLESYRRLGINPKTGRKE